MLSGNQLVFSFSASSASLTCVVRMYHDVRAKLERVARDAREPELGGDALAVDREGRPYTGAWLAV